MRNTLITRPRAHRAAWAAAHPHAMREHGGLLSREDLERWACDRCMAPLDPDRPIRVVGGPEGYSLCERCWSAEDTDFSPCPCEGCKPQ